MVSATVSLLGLTVFISCLGLMGNVFLIVSILQTKFSRVKSFELFLLGLASANFEEIVIVNIYDIIIHQTFITTTTFGGNLLCRFLKFLTVFGEISSILFTILISIYRYQKLRNATKRVNLMTFLDSIRSAWMVSGVCVLLAILLSVPNFIISPQGPAENITKNSNTCPPDFFQCNHNDCPILNKIYKYIFIVMCNLLPLIIVTVTGILIIMVLLRQRWTVQPTESMSGSSQFRKSTQLKFQKSTVTVLAAMTLFQVDWTLYLIFHLTFSPNDFPFWADVEFFISTSYTSISPESCPYRYAEVGNKRERGEKKTRDGGHPRPSRWRPGYHAPLKGVDTVHALWLPLRSARSGRSMRAHTLAWLSASICQFVFTFEGFGETPRPTASTACNSWNLARNIEIISPTVGTRHRERLLKR
ncbi:melatonin receptor type 1A [Xyrichtys novacula]|uniref:Melatonin receptor type 1A n=1 Tax=Xyrichtys novacula TaxID=13765 RepID=A0AAV1GV65_XYRNO|nr:melatonin receptor type 1A [Xyrichtys novacula]